MIGNLKPIKLIQYTQTIDDNGDAQEAVGTVYKMWAEITDEGGSKSMEVGRTAMSDTKTFKINFRGYLVTGDYKVQYLGQTYALTNIKRIQEKRFNYELAGFNTFEATSGGLPDNPVLFDSISYTQETGLITFLDGSFGGKTLVANLRDGDDPNQIYRNRWNEAITPSFATTTNEVTWVYFTPNDNILIRWYFINQGDPTPISAVNEQMITCQQLSIRSFRLYRYGFQNETYQASALENGIYPYNVAGQQLAAVYSIEDYINAMNADATNSQYFQITDFRLVTSGIYADSYLLECTPVNPYYQWNPADTLLYLEAEPI